jgi:hypothetical protein
MDQTLINYLMGGFGAAISFILRVIWEGLRELQKCDLEITSKINEIQLLVAGQYVKKEDLEKLSTALFNKLDRIELKVDGKMDREPK